MSDQLPAPREPGGSDLWGRFSADPRRRPSVRASDADRDVVAQALNRAFSDGRLDAVEHGDRLERALAAKTLGELPVLVDDLAVDDRGPAAAQPSPPESLGRRIRSGTIGTWLALAVLVNLIWLATWLFSGEGPYYYWPIWPMIGTAFPVLLAFFAAPQADERQRRLDERRQRRDGRSLDE